MTFAFRPRPCIKLHKETETRHQLRIGAKVGMAGPLDLELNSERYVELLRKLIGETEHLQNNPPRFVPEEDRLVLH